MFASSEWGSAVEGRTISVAPTAEALEAEVVKIKRRETNSYGEYDYGTEEQYIVFKVGDRYYKKFGYQSSYGSESWDGNVVEVFPETKTILVFE